MKTEQEIRKRLREAESFDMYEANKNNPFFDIRAQQRVSGIDEGFISALKWVLEEKKEED